MGSAHGGKITRQAVEGRKGTSGSPPKASFQLQAQNDRNRTRLKFICAIFFFSFPVKYSQVTKLPVGNKTRIKPSIKGG